MLARSVKKTAHLCGSATTPSPKSASLLQIKLSCGVCCDVQASNLLNIVHSENPQPRLQALYGSPDLRKRIAKAAAGVERDLRAGPAAFLALPPAFLAPPPLARRSASSSAVRLPMPCAAPVTIATRPVFTMPFLPFCRSTLHRPGHPVFQPLRFRCKAVEIQIHGAILPKG